MLSTTIVLLKNTFWRFWDMFCMFNMGMSLFSLGIWMIAGPASLYVSYDSYNEVPLYCTAIAVFIGILFSASIVYSFVHDR